MYARLAFVFCLLVVLFPIVSHGEVWNLSDDFSATQNPNGAWSYGWRDAPEEPLTLYTDTGSDPCGQDLPIWYHNINSQCPMVQHNPFDHQVECWYGHFPANTT